MADVDRREIERLLSLNPGDGGVIARAERLRLRREGLRTEIKQPERVALNHDHPDLTIIGAIDDPQSRDDYGFCILQSWCHTPTGRVFWGQDSGCSCPCPWEDDHFMYDGNTLDTSLTELTPASRETFLRDVESFRADHGERQTFQQATLAAAGL